MDNQAEQNLRILEEIEQNPDITQADLASRLGVAVGSVNWYLKRMVKKGYVKVQQMQRRRLRYLITPQGLAVKARLTRAFMQASMRLYRETRAMARQLLSEVRQAGYSEVYIEGDNDLAEVCYLTCLEQGTEVTESPHPSTPILSIQGTIINVIWPKQ